MLSSEPFVRGDAITQAHLRDQACQASSCRLDRIAVFDCGPPLRISHEPVVLPWLRLSKGGEHGPSDFHCSSHRTGALSRLCRRPHLRRLADAELCLGAAPHPAPRHIPLREATITNHGYDSHHARWRTDCCRWAAEPSGPAPRFTPSLAGRPGCGLPAALPLLSIRAENLRRQLVSASALSSTRAR
jgi:hypothetical protein